MTDNIHSIGTTVPFRDTCGKALSEIPGGEDAADRLSEVYGYPPKSIRTQSQLSQALMQCDEKLTLISKILGPAGQQDPVKVAGAVKFFDAYNAALEILMQCFAATLLPMIKDKGDLASKQSIRLLKEVAQGKSDASAEDWHQLTRLLKHTQTHQDVGAANRADKEKS